MVSQPNQSSVSALLGIEPSKADRIRTARGLLDILFYGPPGVGKTPLLRTAKDVPELSPACCIDFERGSILIYEAGIEVIDFQVYYEGLIKARPGLSKSDALLELISSLRKLHEKAEEEKREPPFRSLLIDGWTEIHEIIAQSVLAYSKSINNKHDIEILDFGDRSRILTRLKVIIRELRSIPVSIIGTAREYERINMDTNALEEIQPQLTGATSDYLVAQTDIVGRVKLVGGNQEVYFSKQGVAQGRDRTTRLPASMKSPTLKEIFAYIRGEKKK